MWYHWVWFDAIGMKNIQSLWTFKKQVPSVGALIITKGIITFVEQAVFLGVAGEFFGFWVELHNAPKGGEPEVAFFIWKHAENGIID